VRPVPRLIAFSTVVPVWGNQDPLEYAFAEPSLEAEMEPQGLVELGNDGWRQLPNAWSQAADVHGSHLLSLGFGRSCQPGCAGLE
jgi:hypothetical protein